MNVQFYLMLYVGGWS